ncbi:MAG TPA: S8 family serine peptidase [Pseudobacteroides sp.]|uniref:S8 family serine peptidase n=1 Tax=Pseudobacteroides sp. TaxID=1968840 RepID=UPI002F92E6BC
MTSRKKILSTILSFFILISALSSYSFGSDLNESDISLLPHRGKTIPKDTERLLIKFKDHKKSSLSKNNIAKKLKSIRFQHYNRLSKTDVVEFSDSKELEYALRLFEDDSNVDFVQPDYRLYKNINIQDPDFIKQWGLSNSGQDINGKPGFIGFDINAAAAWDMINTSSGVLVGILDTGIDLNHEDLRDSMYKNFTENPANNIDDDQNGYVDDYCGWDFINSDSSVYDGEEDDHGTHLAGIIAAGANSAGIRGIASGVRLVPLKFMNGMSGYTSDALEAIEYAKKMGVKIINCSFSDTHYNYALEQAMKNSDILFVCSAGNEKSDTGVSPLYPASYRLPNIISVGAVNNQGSLAPFSNYGKLVDVAAPGVDIYSTLPDNSYGFNDGTSMAAAFVSGTAALLSSCNSSLKGSDLSTIIKSTVNTKYINLQGSIACGGIVDAKSALEYAKIYIPGTSPTNTPTIPTATPAATAAPSESPNTQSDTWKTKSSMDYGKNSFSAAALNGKIYIIGSDRKVQCYEPDSNKWFEVGTLDPSIIDLSSKPILVPLGDKIYIISGSNKMYEYDPVRGKLDPKASTLYSRMGGAAAAYKGRIYICGGEDPQSIKTAEVYDPANDKWSPISGTNHERANHSLAVNGTKLWATGGSINLNSIEEYDIDGDKWNVLKSTHLQISSVTSANGKIYAVGKADSNDGNFYEYDTYSGDWIKKEKMPLDKEGISLFYVNNKIYAVGKSLESSFIAVAEYNFGASPSAIASNTPSPTVTPVSGGQKGITVSGKISLKNIGLVNDLAIDIFAEQDSGKTYSTTVTLKSNSSFQNYSIFIPEEGLSGNYRIGYYIPKGAGNISKTAYYSPDGSVFDVELAGAIIPKDSNISGVDLNILSKRVVSGTISLPNGNKAPQGGTAVYLELGFPDEAYKNSKYKPDYIYNKTMVIPENQTQVQFSFTVLENNNKYKYILGYETNSEGCLSSGFYNKAGTVSKKSSAGYIDVGSSDFTGIELILAGSKYISGNLSLPYGETAPKGGLSVFVAAEGAGLNYDGPPFLNHFIIPEGSTSLKYFINITSNSVSDFYVNYYIDKRGYVKYGYFSNGGTTPYESEASKVSISSGNATSVNLTIIKGRTVSGRVYLPGNKTAPKNGIDVKVAANVYKGTNAFANIRSDKEADLQIVSEMTITENSNNIEYTLTLPNDGIFYLDYLTEKADFVAHGYYTGPRTSTLYNTRKNIFNPSLQNLTECNIELLEGLKFTCTVSLPVGYSAASDIPLLIEFFTINYIAESVDVALSKQITLNKGTSKTDFEVYLPAGNYYLSYYNPKYTQNGYLEYGFCSLTGSKKDLDFGCILSVGPQSQNKAILALIPGPNSSKSGTTYGPNQPGIVVPAPSLKPGQSAPPSSGSTNIVTPKPYTTAKPFSMPFSDMSGHWAKNNILSLLTKGIIDGYPDNTIRPDKEITRAEIAKLIVIMLNILPSKNPDVKFKDKGKIPAWALGYIDILVRNKIMQGYSDNTFRASQFVTRTEMAVIIMKALGYMDAAPSGTISFKDIKSIPSWAANYVKKGAELGIFSGYNDLTFRPDKNITRAEVFKIIDNSLAIAAVNP